MMTLIHIIHSLIKLFSLKRSCFYAETLLRYIYTYNYLYKNTYSYQLQVVNNFLLINLLPPIAVPCFDDFSIDYLYQLQSDVRYQAKRCSLMISNRNKPELIERIGEPSIDRLAECGATLAFTWQSYRQRKG
jgi:hypothetical protein